ncbi:MAG TPA: glycosyltransferase family 1 protein [Thiotrichaceae bacterium]|jgi:phosphatidylinositol alpha-1,6-mannosyltransferase|nr:glycosyltransferase family 1 protein [Thiotrichaceae bacterium]
MKILFISRAYPPVVGGIEKLNFEISHALTEFADIKVIANTQGKSALPFFLFYSFIKALFIARKYDVILLGDGVLGLSGWLLKVLTRKPVVSIIVGLDVTFRNSFYQRLWVKFALKRLDSLFACSNETIHQAVVHGIDEKSCVFIPLGVNLFNATMSQTEARNLLNLQAEKKYLLTIGRLVKRKGVSWFVREVMNKLDNNVIYLIAGDGSDRLDIEKSIVASGLQDRVILLGSVSDEQKVALLQAADIFVQPNIPIEGDMEGFGLVVLEAGAAGLPIVASKLEGLCDAIKHGENGLLVNPEKSIDYAKVLSALLDDDNLRQDLSTKTKRYIETKCLWSHVAQQYYTELATILRA